MAKDGIVRDGATPPRSRTRRRRVLVARLIMLWVLLVTLYFLWEADRYTGLYAWLAEWQLDKLGRYRPVLTFALPVLLFSVPAAWLLLPRSRRGRWGAFAATHPRRAALYTASRFRTALLAFAGGIGGAALLTLLYTITLPRVGKPVATIDVATAGPALPVGRTVTVRGRILCTRTAAFTQDMVLAQRGIRVAPVIAADAGDGPEDDRRLRIFVELLPGDFGDSATAPAVGMRTGVLSRDSLPGSIVRLFRYAGYTVDRPHYFLYASNDTIRRPYYITAVQLLVAALVLLLSGLVQHRHLGRLRGPRITPESATEPSTAA